MLRVAMIGRSPRSIWRAGLWRLIMVPAGEYVVMDLADRIVQAVQGIGDLLHGRVMGQPGRGLQAEAWPSG